MTTKEKESLALFFNREAEKCSKLLVDLVRWGTIAELHRDQPILPIWEEREKNLEVLKAMKPGEVRFFSTRSNLKELIQEVGFLNSCENYPGKYVTFYADTIFIVYYQD